MDSVVGFADDPRGHRLQSEWSEASFNMSIYQPNDDVRSTFAMSAKSSFKESRPSMQNPDYQTNELLNKRMKEER